MNEQPLDIMRLLRALLRGRWVVVTCAVVGILLALGLALARPPLYVARALVLLPSSSLDSNGQPTRNITTEAQIAVSGDVLTIAARQLKPVPKTADLRDHVAVTGPTPDILKFTAKARSSNDAIAIANAVAHGYVVYSSGANSALLEQVVGPLQANANRLQRQIASLQTQIDSETATLETLPANSNRAIAVAGLIDSLHTQQDNATTQLDSVQNQISQAQLNTTATGAGIKVLENATEASNSALRAAGLKLGFGFLVGLLLGVTIALTRDTRDRRLRLRDDIAHAAGAPIVASVSTRAIRTAEEWITLFGDYEASPDEAWGLRRSVRRLVSDGTAPATVAVLTMAGDSSAVAIAPQLAVFAATGGLRTLLVVVGLDPATATLREACTRADGLNPVRPNLWLKTARTGEEVEPDTAQLVVRVVVADHDDLESEARLSAAALLGVSAGEATAERIAVVTATATEAQRPVLGVIVANPEPGDGTAGRVPDPFGARHRLPDRLLGSQPGSAS